MNITSRITKSAATLAFAAVATTATAEEAPQIQLAATVKFPEFVCWDKGQEGRLHALFTQSLAIGSQHQEYGTPRGNGQYAYPFEHIEERGNPGQYGLNGHLYFQPEFPQMMDEALKGLSEADREAMRAIMDAFVQSDDVFCDEPADNPAMLLG